MDSSTAPKADAGRGLDGPSPSDIAPLPDLTKTKHSTTELPPLVTARASPDPRRISLANKRYSSYSGVAQSLTKSRPQSDSFPAFHSSLSYTLVRDFAYQSWHPLHYGPPPEPSPAESTPVDEIPRRLSEPASMYDVWDPEMDTDDFGTRLPARSYGDGPPWREDEDLHSPVVTASRHKKNKSSINYFDFAPQLVRGQDGRRTSYAGDNTDGTKLYYVDQAGETLPDGPGGEYISYPSRGPNDAAPWSQQRYAGDDDEGEDDDDGFPPREYYEGDSRYSKDYTFSIASPDEEMHGKAVALFDFTRENDNELPLVEGQVLWVSYRHGQGWLVAQDPKSGEKGLVPEEYVRLLRDIEGGLNGLNGHSDESPVLENDTPTAQMADTEQTVETHPKIAHYVPVISHFSTSSKDLERYPPHLLGSQANTPVSGGSEPHFGPGDENRPNSASSAIRVEAHKSAADVEAKKTEASA